MPQFPGVRHRFVGAGDLKMHVAVAGQGEPVILLHGWPEHWYAWRAVIPPLAERYQVLAPDLRGFGWTDIAWKGFDKENMAGDILRLMDALEIERARIVGHDWGGWIGFLLALGHPERVSQLAVLGVASPWARPTPGNLLAARRLSHMVTLAAPYAAQRLLQHHPGYIRRLIRRWAHDRSRFDKEDFRIYSRDLRSPTRARASALLYRTFVLRELLPVMAGRYRRLRLGTPTLILHGKRDGAVAPRLVAGGERQADDLRVELLPDVGHFPHEERPEAVAEKLIDFFAEAGEPAVAGAPAGGRQASAAE